MSRALALLLATLLAVFMASAARAEGPVTIVDDPAVLAALDAKGYGFAAIFGVAGEGDVKTLYDKAPAYQLSTRLRQMLPHCAPTSRPVGGRSTRSPTAMSAASWTCAG